MSRQPVACAGDRFPCACQLPMPHVCGEVVLDPTEAAAPHAVMVGGKPVATLGSITMCAGTVPGAIITGSGTVFAHGKPVARRFDQVAHGTTLVDGASDVVIGDWHFEAVQVIQRGHVTITVDHVRHTITFSGVIEYYGDGATTHYMEGALASIRRVWSGPVIFEGSQYTLVPDITGRIRDQGADPDPNATAIHVFHTTQGPDQTTLRLSTATNQPLYGVRDGRQHDTDLQEPNIPAHEFAHAMGLDDGYIDPPVAPGQVRSTYCGNTDNDIQCDAFSPGARPTNEAIYSLINDFGLAPPPRGQETEE